MKYSFVFILLVYGPILYGQKKCFQFRMEIMDETKKQINEKRIHQDNLERLYYNLTYFNCGDFDISYTPKPIIANDYTKKPDIYTAPIFARIYKKDSKGNEYFYYYSNLEYFKFMEFDNLILEPGVEKSIGGGTFSYFQYLPVGEYYVYFDFLSDYKLFDQSSDYSDGGYRNEHDSIMVSLCHCGYSCYITDGYYFQTNLKNKIHFTIVK